MGGASAPPMFGFVFFCLNRAPGYGASGWRLASSSSSFFFLFDDRRAVVMQGDRREAFDESIKTKQERK